MAQIDKTREEIGWLKAIFVLLAALDISLIGWAVQNIAVISIWILSLAGVLVLVLSITVVEINRRAYHKIQTLGER